MIRHALWLAALLAWPALAKEYNRFDLSGSRVSFVSKQMGVPVEGRFSRFTAKFSFDPDKPQAARAAVDIDVASIDAGSAEANEEVTGKNWFAVKQYPVAHFESTRVMPLGDDRYQVSGRLTIRNVTRDVVAPFTFKNGVFEGRYTLRRLDYGIGQGVWSDVGVVADEVEVRFRIQAGAPLK